MQLLETSMIGKGLCTQGATTNECLNSMKAKDLHSNMKTKDHPQITKDYFHNMKISGFLSCTKTRDYPQNSMDQIASGCLMAKDRKLIVRAIFNTIPMSSRQHQLIPLLYLLQFTGIGYAYLADSFDSFCGFSNFSSPTI